MWVTVTGVLIPGSLGIPTAAGDDLRRRGDVGIWFAVCGEWSGPVD